MPYSVTIETVAPRLLAATRGRATLATLAETIPPLFDIVYAHLRANGIEHLGLNFILYSPLSEADFVLDAGVEIPAPFASTDAVRCIETPSGRSATTVHFGEYEALPAAHSAIRAWCAAQGETLAGPNWEAYGHWHDDPAQRRTDVYYLLVLETA
jgi:effector-binding domain-containing protein